MACFPKRFFTTYWWHYHWDFYLRHKRNYAAPKQYKFKSVNWAAMIAWVLAIAVSKLSPESGLLSIAPLNAILTAIVVHVFADKLIYGEKNLEAISTQAVEVD